MKKSLVLIISLSLGLVAAVLTRAYVASKEAEVTDRIRRLNDRYGTMEALVYKCDVPAGTVLTEKEVGVTDVPKMGLRGQAPTKEDWKEYVRGRRTQLSHAAEDIVFWSDLADGAGRSRGLSADIKRTMRAISINCSGAASVSGMVKPNDHVDVIGTFAFPSADGKVKREDVETRTILQNVLVLATGQTTAKTRVEDMSYAPGYTTVTLEVTPREAEILAFTEQMKGRLVLTLRNRTDTTSENQLPKIDFEKVKGELEQLNKIRQERRLYGGNG